MKTLTLIITALVAIACGTDPVASSTATESTFDSCAVNTDCTGEETCNSQGICVMGGQDGAMGNPGTNGKDGKDGKDGANGTSFKSCPDQWTCADGESCNGQGICVPKTVAIVVESDECQVDVDCGNGPTWCADGGLYYNQGICQSGTCVKQSKLIKACTYGCTDGSGCHSAPPVCTVGASCDDGDSSTTNDRLNENCACVGTATSAPACDDFNPCTQGTTFVNGLCAGGTINVGATCDDGDSATTGDQCNASGVCNGTPIVLPTVNCYTLRVKQGFQFFGLVSYPDANNGWPVGEWQNLGREVTWCEGQVFGFNVVTNHEGEAQDWVGSGNVDGQGNLCSGAVPNITLIPQGINPKWTLNEVFDGSKPADLNGVFICSPGGWDDWLMPSPPAN